MISLKVDATDTARGIFRVSQSVPLGPARSLTLLYPKWLPGNHAPRGPLQNLAGLRMEAEGRPVAWTRDPLEPYAFHVALPEGAGRLDISFDYLTPVVREQGRVVVTPDMLNLQWNAVILYPAGHYTRDIQVTPELVLPADWQAASALEAASREGQTTRYRPVSVETLVDSPVFAGRHYRRVVLDGGPRPVALNIFADAPEQLEATPAQIEAHRRLVAQADRLFATRPFDRYEFLLALSARLGGIGLEHHRSSENGVGQGYFLNWDGSAPDRDLLPHEYAHAWNGKHRRPADLWTPDFQTPMRNSLLWVYEGQTQYWGYVLAARAGLITRQEMLDALAMTAATYELRPGRSWRPLGDTVNDPVVLARRPQPWTSWQRNEDYYSEGQLLWLEVDALIRERSGTRRSLDDFARRFLGGSDGDWGVSVYDFDQVVAALEAVEPYDWRGFLTRRVNEAPAPLEGLSRAGYRLVYDETPSAYFSADEQARKILDHTYSIGLVLNRDGEIRSVLWEGPAWRAGLTNAAKIVAVNGWSFEPERLKNEIARTRTPGVGLELLVKEAERYRTVRIDYAGGLRYPHLERLPGRRDLLGDILKPR